MSYTPINWQNGDTITAEKMNKMDNGWGVESTQLFSETVTTVAGAPAPSGTLNYSEFIDATELPVTVDGVDYVLPSIGNGGFGEAGQQGPSFTHYPVFILSRGESNIVYTESAGTYTISAFAENTAVSAGFSDAVMSVINQQNIAPLELVEDVTHYNDARAAFNNGQTLFFKYGLDKFFVTSVDFGSEGVKFIPESTSFTAGFSDNDSLFYFTYL